MLRRKVDETLATRSKTRSNNPNQSLAICSKSFNIFQPHIIV